MKNRIILFSLLIICLLGLATGGFAKEEEKKSLITSPDFPKPGDTAMIEKTVNGITVKIIGVKQSIEERDIWSYSDGKTESEDHQVLTIDVCFTTPDAGDWSLWGPKDMVSSESLSSWIWDRIPNPNGEISADGVHPGEKCERYVYDFAMFWEIRTPFTLRFDQLFAARSKASHPCIDMLERFTTNPRAVEAGLEVGCGEMPTGNPPGVEFKYDASVYLKGYDESKLTKQKAHVLMLEIESGVVYGPWEFTIDSLNKEVSQP